MEKERGIEIKLKVNMEIMIDRREMGGTNNI